MSMNHLTVQKLGKPIAVGRTAEIYDWGPGRVLKLYFEEFGKAMAEHEHRIATAICATGLSVPAVGEVIYVNGRAGLSYQKIVGVEMGLDMKQHPSRFITYSCMMAELQAEMHASPFQANIPPLRDRLDHKIKEAEPLPEKIRKFALEALSTMPGGDRLCHGYFHFGNILLSEPKPTIIDWIDASIGNPLADVARTSILVLGYADVVLTGIQRLNTRAMHAIYLRKYFQLRPKGMDEYRRWLPIIAAARLSENVTGWNDWLLAQAFKLL